MKYRILPAEEWDRLVPLMEGHEGNLPSPLVATAAVAEDDDGEIQGCLFLQLVLHMEPLVIRKPEVSFLRLQQAIEERAKRGNNGKQVTCYCFTDSEKTARMAELAGGQPTDYKIWRKEL